MYESQHLYRVNMSQNDPLVQKIQFPAFCTEPYFTVYMVRHLNTVLLHIIVPFRITVHRTVHRTGTTLVTQLPRQHSRTLCITCVSPLSLRSVQDTFAGMIEDAGFQAAGYENVLGGVVAMHSGYKLP